MGEFPTMVCIDAMYCAADPINFCVCRYERNRVGIFDTGVVVKDDTIGTRVDDTEILSLMSDIDSENICGFIVR